MDEAIVIKNTKNTKSAQHFKTVSTQNVLVE